MAKYETMLITSAALDEEATAAQVDRKSIHRTVSRPSGAY